MTAFVVTVALLGLCAGAAAAPMNVPIRISQIDETFDIISGDIISGDLDFPSPLVGPEVVFDPWSDVPDDPSTVVLPLNTTLEAPEPPAALLFPLAVACLALGVIFRRLAASLRSLGKPRRSSNWRKVKREFRMMA